MGSGVGGLSRKPRCTRRSPGEPWPGAWSGEVFGHRMLLPHPHPVLNATDEGPTGQRVVSGPVPGLGLGYHRGPGEKAIRAFTSPSALPEVTSAATPSPARVPSPSGHTRRTARHFCGPAIPAKQGAEARSPTAP